MADQQENIDQIDSSELFESALSDDPAPETGQVAEAEVTGQPRDESGRFAAKAPEPVQQAEQPAKDDASVPSWRLREISEERRAAVARAEEIERNNATLRAQMAEMERRIAAAQPKSEPVDEILADPNGFMSQRLSPIQQAIEQVRLESRLELSRLRNYQKHGEEAVNSAEQAVAEAMQASDPEVHGLRAKMLVSNDPVGVVVDWHKSRSFLKETGGNIDAYRQRILDEAMKDPAYQAKVIEAARGQVNGGTQPRNITRLPPSLNKVGSAGNDAADNDMSDGALFAHALR